MTHSYPIRALALAAILTTGRLLASAPAAPAANPPATPVSLPGAETHIYRDLHPIPLRLFVFKPKHWAPSDRRPALVFFFGGGWVKGTPDHSAGWGRTAASLGLVGIVPDYRVKDRFGTSPLESVADARAALRWVQDRAAELGIDPARIVVGGSSAGGHLALWTAIARNPPGSDPAEAPLRPPAALILVSPVSDTSLARGYAPQRFGANQDALSPVGQLDPRMPPVLVFHGDADTTVPQAQSLALRDRLLASGNFCEFINVPGGDHHFETKLPEWRPKVLAIIERFLIERKIVAAPPPPGRNFDLTRWKLTLPTGVPGRPDEVASSSLMAGGYSSPYFFTGADGAMVFWSPVNGATTSGSHFPRSELREMRTDGRAYNWREGDGTSVLHAICAVLQAPAQTGKVVIGQIHGASINLPLLKLAYDQGRVVALIKKTSRSDADTAYPLAEAGLGRRIDYEIRLEHNLLSVTANGGRVRVPLDPDWAARTLYFKAGDYVQANGASATDGAAVAFYSLHATHEPFP